MTTRNRAPTLPPVEKIIAFLQSRGSPATVSQFGHRFSHVPTAQMRAYLRRLASVGMLAESKNDSDTLQFSLPTAVCGLDAIYRPELPTRYTVRVVSGYVGMKP